MNRPQAALQGGLPALSRYSTPCYVTIPTEIQDVYLIRLRSAPRVVQGPEEEHGPGEHGVKVLRWQVQRERQEPKQAHAQRGHSVEVGCGDTPVVWQHILHHHRQAVALLCYEHASEWQPSFRLEVATHADNGVLYHM